MKPEDLDFDLKEAAVTRKPQELYHVWYGTTQYYRTSMDASFTFGGNVYTPAPIKRGRISYSLEFSVSTCDVTVSGLTPEAAAFLGSTPTEAAWVEIYRCFQDDPSITPALIFVGELMNTSVQGLSVNLKFGSYETRLKRLIPRFRVQPFCNWTLFDTYCAITKSAALHQWTGTVAARNDIGNLYTLTGMTAWFGGETRASWLKFGYFQYGYQYRTIESVPGTDLVQLQFPLNAPVGATVTLEMGCGGTETECKNNWNNYLRFGGHPFLPIDNPTLWF